jgi:hypothetical protein
MSDSDFVDVGDELVVRISGYPVGRCEVLVVNEKGIHVQVDGEDGAAWFTLPLNVKDYDIVDGVAHNTLPAFDGTNWNESQERADEIKEAARRSVASMSKSTGELC